MELQIQDLLSSIRSEGIDKAEKEAAAIISDAEKKAEVIIANARAEAASLRDNAQKEAEVFRDNARLNAEQAKRDAVLTFKAEIRSEFEKLLAADVRKSLNEKTLTALIIAALNGENVSDYEAEVKEVTDSLKRELADQLKAGLEIRPSKRVQAGFRLSAKDGSGYFDCTDDEISKMLIPFFRDINL